MARQTENERVCEATCCTRMGNTCNRKQNILLRSERTTQTSATITVEVISVLFHLLALKRDFTFTCINACTGIGAHNGRDLLLACKHAESCCRSIGREIAIRAQPGTRTDDHA